MNLMVAWINGENYQKQNNMYQVFLISGARNFLGQFSTYEEAEYFAYNTNIHYGERIQLVWVSESLDYKYKILKTINYG